MQFYSSPAPGSSRPEHVAGKRKAREKFFFSPGVHEGYETRTAHILALLSLLMLSRTWQPGEGLTEGMGSLPGLSSTHCERPHAWMPGDQPCGVKKLHAMRIEQWGKTRRARRISYLPVYRWTACQKLQFLPLCSPPAATQGPEQAELEKGRAMRSSEHTRQTKGCPP